MGHGGADCAPAHPEPRETVPVRLQIAMTVICDTLDDGHGDGVLTSEGLELLSEYSENSQAW